MPARDAIKFSSPPSLQVLLSQDVIDWGEGLCVLNLPAPLSNVFLSLWISNLTKYLEVEIVLPNRKSIRGMGLRRGITLVVGGGFHGKSTLLQALDP